MRTQPSLARPPHAAGPPQPARIRVWRRGLGLVLTGVALAAAVAGSLAVGAREVPLGQVIDGLRGTGPADISYLMLELRLPRTLAGLAAGAALGVAGALMQALTRNPLADPGILGVNAGAAFCVALGVAAFGITSVTGYVWFALAGALLATIAVWLIGAAGRGRVDPARLTLGGVAVAAVLSGITTALILADPRAFDQLRLWTAGSLVDRPLNLVAFLTPFLAAGLILAALVARPLNAVALGDDLAHALGTHLARTRVLVIAAVTLLAGGATALAGPIGFIGLMTPHIARWIVGPDHRWILACTLTLTPALLLGADVLGRIVMRPAEVPIGIVSALVGAPVLIILVRRRRASGL